MDYLYILDVSFKMIFWKFMKKNGCGTRTPFQRQEVSEQIKHKLSPMQTETDP